MAEEPVADGATITNKQEATEVSIIKVWDDADNQDGKRPEELTVTLSNGMEVVLNEENKWSATIENLPKYDKETEIEYTWSEEMPEGYKLESTEKDGTITTITNTHTPSKININVTKKWDDLNNNFGLRPGTITVRLKADEKEIKSVAIREKDNWKYTFKDLDEYSNGKKITYTVTEDKVEYYTLTISGNVEKGFILTNKIIPMGGGDVPPEPIAGTTVPLHSNNPSTRSKDNIKLYISLITLAIVAIIIVTKREKDRDKKIRILNKANRVKFK